ncbi:UNKNOWN [Stylonychia lemnae]|uniref:Uncharacterized protein n=1 Tax=Stylonychia lemnae TaxID=5949 RepID=A0A078AAA5_STYLE|nr:UNKNOWN [Stylonychia lemnae]|eukprot:CDW78512.1 UNKNOWN [Stylonychia lemnae]
MLVNQLQMRRNSNANEQLESSINNQSDISRQSMSMSSTLQKYVTKREMIFLNKTSEGELNQSQISGLNDSRDMSDTSSIGGNRSKLLIQKDKTSNQIWVQRIPKLANSMDLPPPTNGQKRKVRAKPKTKQKTSFADSSTSNAEQSSINDMSQTQIQIEIPNNSQNDDNEQPRARLESIAEDTINETEEDQQKKSSFINSKQNETPLKNASVYTAKFGNSLHASQITPDSQNNSYVQPQGNNQPVIQATYITYNNTIQNYEFKDFKYVGVENNFNNSTQNVYNTNSQYYNQNAKKRKNPQDMYPKDSIDYLTHNLDKQSLIHTISNADQDVINQILLKQHQQIASQQDDMIILEQPSSEFQSVDLFNNSIQISRTGSIPNLNSIQSFKKLDSPESFMKIPQNQQSNYQSNGAVNSLNLSQAERSNDVNKKNQINLNKRISIIRPQQHMQQLKKIQSLQSIEQLDKNSEISPPNKYMVTDEDLKGSVISIDNYNNISIQINNDSELKNNKDLRAFFQAQIIRPMINDQGYSPAYESLLLNESYDETLRKKLNQVRSTHEIQTMEQKSSRNSVHKLRNSGGSGGIKYPSFGGNGQDFSQVQFTEKQEQQFVPSLLRYNKQNLNLKETSSSLNVSSNQVSIDPIQTLMQSEKTIKIIRTPKDSQKNKGIFAAASNTQQEEPIRKQSEKKIETITIKLTQLKDIAPQEQLFDTIVEAKGEQEQSPARKLSKITSQIQSPDLLSPKQSDSQQANNQQTQNSKNNTLSLNSSPGLNSHRLTDGNGRMISVKFVEREFIKLMDDSIDMGSERFNTQRASINEKQSIKYQHEQVAKQFSDQKPKQSISKTQRVTFQEENERLFHSAMSLNSIPSQSPSIGTNKQSEASIQNQRQKSISKTRSRVSTNDVVQRLYQTSRASKSPLRSSLKKMDSENDPFKSGKTSPQNFQTFTSLPQSAKNKIFSGLRDDFSHQLSLLKADSSPGPTMMRKMPIIENKEKKIVKLILDDDDDEQEELTIKNQAKTYQINSNITPSDLSFFESYDSRKQFSDKKKKPLYKSAISTNLTSRPTTQLSNLTKQPQIKKPSIITGDSRRAIQTSRNTLVKSSRDNTPGTPQSTALKALKEKAPLTKVGIRNKPGLSKQSSQQDKYFEPYQEKKKIEGTVSHLQLYHFLE